MALLTTLTGVALIILGFGALIFVHELGHFLAAKWAGIRTLGFAVGMGPSIVSWRRGVGFALGSTDRKVRAIAGHPADRLDDEELRRHGLGETEYSLRCLPIGGFVRMLGQEDANPAATSDDPRSYGRCPVPRRMVVVSAGVVMNVLLAIVLFVIAFMVGVRFEAPVVGEVHASAPAARAIATNAAELGVTEPGLKPGDLVLRIDGDEAATFADVQIATAMAAPDEPILLEIARRGVAEPLRFEIVPEESRDSGLLSIGIGPGRSTTLIGDRVSAEAVASLIDAAAPGSGILPGMRLVSVNGREIETWGELVSLADDSDGAPLATTWRAVDDDGGATGALIEATIEVEPRLDRLTQRTSDGILAWDPGLLGLVPALRVAEVGEKGANVDLLRAGDVIIEAAGIAWPRWTQLGVAARERARGVLPLRVRRGETTLEIAARVDRDGMLGIAVAWELDAATIASPVLATESADGPVPTPAAALDLVPGSRILSVAGSPVGDWKELRAALLEATADSGGSGASIALELALPTPGEERERVVLALDAASIARLRGLGWTVPLPAAAFEPVTVVRSAEGSPWRGVVMGVRETHKLIMMTYLTIDRLVRGTVGVEQLHGPVGIIHLGTQILPQGFTYFLFFLGMISINLAVINFLPLPIVDGGLFLFLVYERVKGRPPSIGFQNAATAAGLCLIAAAFLVTFYNDLLRLFA